MNRFSDLTTQLAAACLGAGVITTVAVAQGQNPITALGITLFSAVAAVMVGQVLLLVNSTPLELVVVQVLESELEKNL